MQPGQLTVIAVGSGTSMMGGGHSLMHLPHQQIQAAKNVARQRGFVEDVKADSFYKIERTFPLTYMMILWRGTDDDVRAVMSAAGRLHGGNGVAKIHMHQEKDLIVRRGWSKAILQPFSFRSGSGGMEVAQTLAQSVGRLRCYLTKPIAWRSQRLAYFILRDAEAFASWQVLARLFKFAEHHTVTVLDTLPANG